MIKAIKDRAVKAFASFSEKDQELDFYYDEYWLVYEAILFALVINADIKTTEISTDFPFYEKVVLTGIEDGELSVLKNATKKGRKRSHALFDNIVRHFALTKNIELERGSQKTESIAASHEIDMSLMLRCIPSKQVKNYFVSQGKIHPREMTNLRQGADGGGIVEPDDTVNYEDSSAHWCDQNPSPDQALESKGAPLPEDDSTSSNVARLHLLNSLASLGIKPGLIITEISAEDLGSLYSLVGPPAKPDPAHLAGKNKNIRDRKIKATNYMLKVVASGCQCNHAKLAKFALTHTGEWLVSSTEKNLSIAQLKELSILIVPPNRRYRKNQITGETSYSPSECNCERPGHT